MGFWVCFVPYKMCPRTVYLSLLYERHTSDVRVHLNDIRKHTNDVLMP